MTPILGVIASQITGHLSTNSFESIQTVTVGSGGQSSISFTSIPSTYKHLQIRAISRSSKAITGAQIAIMQFNGDTNSANYYSTHNIAGNGSTAYAQSIANVGASGIWGGTSTGNSTASSIFGTFVTDILDYSSTNKNKVSRSLQGLDNNSTDGIVYFVSGLWLSTSAINQVTFVDNSGLNFVQYSSFALYGIKG